MILLVLAVAAASCYAAYDPPNYPPQLGAVQSISMRLPQTAAAGGSVQATFEVAVTRAVTDNRKLWLHLAKDNKVYDVQVLEPTVPAQKWLPGRPATLGPYSIVIPADLPAGTYSASAGIYTEEPVATGQMEITGSTSTRQPMLITTGCFVDKYRTPHRWFINKAHTLIWDGKPFIPAGGMFIYDRDWNLVKAQIDQLKHYGVKNIYLHLGVNQPYVWKDYNDDDYRFFQQTIDYLDANGFTYGIEFQALEANGPGYSYPGGIGVDHVQSSGTVRAQAKDPRSAVFLVVENRTGKVVQTGTARVVENKFLEADVRLAAKGDYRVIFAADKAGPDGFVMYYWDDKYEKYVAKVRDHYSKVKLGPGFRFLVDPLWNEMNTNHDFIPSAPAFAEQFAEWLEKRYGTIEALNKAWKPVGGAWATFSAAGSSISLDRIDDKSTGKLMQYAYSRSAKRFYTMEACASQFNYDIREFIGRSLLYYCNDIADVFKQMNDVPVIYKAFSDVDWWHINDTGLASGHDGLGMESYGTGEPMLLFMGIHIYGECEQAAKTTWLIATETAEGNHQDACLSRNKLLGYSDRLGTMYANFNALLSGGAKGIYHYNMIGGKSLQEPWSDNLSRDPRQLEWLATYDRILENATKLADYKPPVYFRFPALFHPCSGELYSEPCADFFNMGGWWPRETVERSINNIWIVPSFSLRPEAPMSMVNIENTPASIRFAGELTQAITDGKRITMIGYRKDLGSIPAVDKYYTSDYAEDELGRRFQILKPTPTSRVLNATWKGQVWNLMDGNLQINSVEVHGRNGYQPQDLAVGPEKPIDPYDGMFRDLLGVKLAETDPNLSWLSYVDGGVPVTVISALKDKTEIALPNKPGVEYLYVDGRPAGKVDGDIIRIPLQPSNRAFVRAKYDWGPEGIMVDSFDSTETVIVRGLSPYESVPRSASGRVYSQAWDRAAKLPEAESKELTNLLDQAANGRESAPLILASTLARTEENYYSAKTPYVWIEGESPKSHRFNLAALGGMPKLSGRGFLGLETSIEPPNEIGWNAVYEFEVARPGTYQLWLRENLLSFSSPCSYIVDGGRKIDVPNMLVPVDIQVVTEYNAVEDTRQLFAWYHYGEVELAPGRHTLTLLVNTPRSKGSVLGMAEQRPYAKLIDCILLTQRGFTPDGKERPHYLEDRIDPPMVNLLRNPSVEYDSNGDGKCDGWEPSMPSGLVWTKPDWGNLKLEGLFDVNLYLRKSYAMLRSLEVTAGPEERGWSSDKIGLGSSQSFTLGGWLRTGDPDGEALLRVKWFDPRGKLIRSNEVRPASRGTEWQEVKQTLTRPKGSSWAVLQCLVPAGAKGTAWFDELVFATRFRAK